MKIESLTLQLYQFEQSFSPDQKLIKISAFLDLNNKLEVEISAHYGNKHYMFLNT